MIISTKLKFFLDTNQNVQRVSFHPTSENLKNNTFLIYLKFIGRNVSYVVYCVLRLIFKPIWNIRGQTKHHNSGKVLRQVGGQLCYSGADRVKLNIIRQLFSFGTSYHYNLPTTVSQFFIYKWFCKCDCSIWPIIFLLRKLQTFAVLQWNCRCELVNYGARCNTRQN